MKAVCWYGADDLRVEQVLSRVVNPRDAIAGARGTCGSTCAVRRLCARHGQGR